MVLTLTVSNIHKSRTKWSHRKITYTLNTLSIDTEANEVKFDVTHWIFQNILNERGGSIVLSCINLYPQKRNGTTQKSRASWILVPNENTKGIWWKMYMNFRYCQNWGKPDVFYFYYFINFFMSVAVRFALHIVTRFIYSVSRLLLLSFLICMQLFRADDGDMLGDDLSCIFENG